MTNALTRIALAALAAACLIAGPMLSPASAQEPRTALFLIDGSGSMWARFDSPGDTRAKIDVARELLRPLIAKDAQTRIGLASYGHRRRSDCSDMEVIAAPASERAGVLEALDKLNPRGKGPLAEALKMAAQAIGPARPATIVVINDGIDNCRQDMCAAAQEAAKLAPGVPIHVVAIGIAPSEHPLLQCVTDATGGTFSDVRDPVGLAAAISSVTELALGAPTPAASEAKAQQTAQEAAATLPAAPLRATLSLVPGGKPLDLAARWRIFKDGSEDVLREMTAAAISETLKPGNYILEAGIDGISARAPFSVDTDKPATLALALNGARLMVKSTAKDATADPAHVPLVTIREARSAGGGRTVLLGRPGRVDTVLAPASYVVAVADQHVRQERTVDLTAGSETLAEFDLKSGTLSLAAALQEGGAHLEDVTFSIQEDDPDSPDGRREILRSRAGDPSFTLGAGTYYAAVRSGLAEARERVAISAGDALQKVIVLPAAELTLTAAVGEAPVPDGAGLTLSIQNLSEPSAKPVRLPGPQFTGLLNAGRYRISARFERHAVSASRDIVIEAGKPVREVLSLAAGDITFKGPPGTGAVAGEAMWEVRDAAGKAVWHSAAAAPRVLLAPGRYAVRLESRDKLLEAAFEVSSGSQQTIELGTH